MSNPAEIQNVSDTAIWVAYYRGKESDRPDALFHDPLAKVLTAERGERIAQSFGAVSRRTEWTILMRTVLIDDYLLRAVADGVDAVVNLGAGLDTRPYRMQLPPTLQWVEADFPHMVEFKNTMLHEHAPRCALQRVGVDLSDATARRRFLAGVAPGAKRIVVLTEGVIPYLTEDQVGELATDLHAQPRFAFWIAEHFSPEVYRYLQAISKSPMLAKSPFRFFPLDWSGFFREHGWLRQEIRYTSEAGVRTGRLPHMPLWVRLMLPFISRTAKERMRRMAGYVLMVPRG